MQLLFLLLFMGGCLIINNTNRLGTLVSSPFDVEKIEHHWAPYNFI
jgi:hypothetical protein